MATSSLALRDYQRDAIDAVNNAWANGTMRPAVVLPTGAGKTVIFSHLVKRIHETNDMIDKTLIIVHRDELITQTVSKIKDVDPSLKVGVVKADRNEIDGFTVIVASIQTIRRANRLDQLQGIGVVIVDECHHAAADSYVSVMKALGCFDDVSPTPAVGFTATMARDDKKELAEIWDEVVFTMDVLDLIGHNPPYLTDVEGRMITIDGLSLNQAKVTRGDYSETSLSDLLLDAEAQKIVADAYVEHCRNADGTFRKGILFAPTVKAAKAFTEAFEAKGIPSGMVWGSMPMEDRRLIFKRYAKGEIRVLHNCMVATEGFDQPDAEVCVIARPTRSAALYVQMVGRVLRIFPGKGTALVLDVVGASEDHTLATLADLSSKRIDKVEPGETLIGAAKRLAKKGVASLKGYIKHKDVDLFHRSKTMWQKTEAGIFFISTTCEDPETCQWSAKSATFDKPCSGHLIFLWPGNEIERYKVGVVPTHAKGGRWLREDVSIEYGMEWAEQEAGRNSITKKSASWRKRNEPATGAQVNYATRLGINVPDGVTKSDLSDMINIRVASNRLDPKTRKG